MSFINRTILVVDDESEQRDAMRDILRRAGCVVLEAADYRSAEAIHRGYSGAIDLLVIDVSLPGGNGCELARALMARDPKLRVLFISGHVGAEILRFYGVSAADDIRFLEKPFQSEDLLTRIRCVLGRDEPLGSGAASA